MGAHKKTKTMNKHSIHILRYTKNQAKGCAPMVYDMKYKNKGEKIYGREKAFALQFKEALFLDKMRKFPLKFVT